MYYEYVLVKILLSLSLMCLYEHMRVVLKRFRNNYPPSSNEHINTQTVSLKCFFSLDNIRSLREISDSSYMEGNVQDDAEAFCYVMYQEMFHTHLGT